MSKYYKFNKENLKYINIEISSKGDGKMYHLLHKYKKDVEKTIDNIYKSRDVISLNIPAYYKAIAIRDFIDLLLEEVYHE